MDPARLATVEKAIDGLLEQAIAAAMRPVRKVIKLAGVVVGTGDDSDGGESTIGRAEDTASLWLADAGMVLRDPPVLHLLLHEAVSVACFLRALATVARMTLSIAGSHP